MGEQTPNYARIKNGSCRTNNGWRQVVLSPEGEVRPVQSAKLGGNILSGKCTTQFARKGDYVVRNEYYPHARTYHQWDGLEMTDVRKSDVPDAVLDKASELGKWLSAVGVQESFLPSGYGWDGVNTVASVRKEQRIRALFKDVPDEYVKRWLEIAQFSPREDIATSWMKDWHTMVKQYPVLKDERSQAWVVRYPSRGEPVFEEMCPEKPVPLDTRSMIIVEEYYGDHGVQIHWVLFRKNPSRPK